jgi:hypothetical protein
VKASPRRLPVVLALFAASFSIACHKQRAAIAPAPQISPSPLTLSCSFDRASVIVDSGDTIPVHVRVTSPGNSRFDYFWTASSGTLKGTGPDMLWNPHRSPPGAYAISVRVIAERGAQAVCSMDVHVEPNPPSESRPPTSASN